MIGTIIINMFYLKQKFGRALAAWFYGWLIDIAIILCLWIVIWLLTSFN